MNLLWFPLTFRNVAMSWYFLRRRRLGNFLDGILVASGTYLGSLLALKSIILPEWQFLWPTLIVLIPLAGYLLAGVWFKRWIDKGAADVDKVSDILLIILSGVYAGGLMTFVIYIFTT